jgi:hypothetical protein
MNVTFFAVLEDEKYYPLLEKIIFIFVSSQANFARTEKYLYL